MIVYEVIKDCSISYTENGGDSEFPLNKGDFLFIEPDFCWVKKESRFTYESAYSKKSMLVKIYHNKLVTIGDKPEDSKYEWTWVNNINLIEPMISTGQKEPVHKISENFDMVNPFTGSPFCKNVTAQWQRDEKLNSLLNNQTNLLSL